MEKLTVTGRYENMMKSGIILVLMACIILSPQVNAESINTNQKITGSAGMMFTIKDCTYNFTSEKQNQELDRHSRDKETLRIPPAVKKYDLVTFDHQGINSDLRSISPHLSFLIDGMEYPADLKRMDFESIDDGIDSYSGTLVGERNSSVLLTISDAATIGSVTHNDETFYIEPVQQEAQVEITDSLPHIIYSSKDVEDQEFLIDNGPVNSINNKPNTVSQSRALNSDFKSNQLMDTFTDSRTAVTPCCYR
jgi:hypothetical protein